MATTNVVLLTDSTGSWFWDGTNRTRFFPKVTYDRYGKTVTVRYNNSYSTPSYDAETTVWYGGEGSDTIALFSNGPGGANWDDIDAAALQACVTDVDPDLVLIALGINGGATGATGLDALIDDVQAAVPAATVVLLSQNPIVSHNGGDEQNRDIIQGYATSYSLLFVDVYQAFIDYGDWDPDLVADGVHPTDQGKQLYADTVDPPLFSAGLLGSAEEESIVAVLDSAEMVLRANRYSGSGDWLDESGNGHDAVPSGSPTWDGEKFTLDGSTQYFTIPDHDNLDPGAGDITVVVVASWASGASNGFLIEKRAGGVPWWNAASNVSTERASAAVNDGTDTLITNSPNGSWPADTRGTVSWRIIRASNQQRTGVDSSFQSGDASAIGPVSSPTDVTVGRWADFDSNYFEGDIWGVAIFTTSLSDADVAAAGEELIASPSGNRMGGTGAIRKPPRYA